MSLVRFVARSMVASHFITDGVHTLRQADELAESADGFTSKAIPLVQRIVPASYSSYVPEEAKSWVRISGLMKITGGAMFATGIGRRLGAALLIPATILDIAVSWPEKSADQDQRKIAQREALKNVALLGATILATRDLQGSPSLSWRAENSRKMAAKQAASARDTVAKLGRKAKRKARKAARELQR